MADPCLSKELSIGSLTAGFLLGGQQVMLGDAVVIVQG
jgi:hypothetical protein